MSPQPGTAGTGDDPLAQLVTQELTVNGQTVTRLVGLAFDSADQTDGVLRFDGSGSTNGITDGSAKVLVNGTVHDVAGAEWVDLSGTKHTVDSWEKVINSQFDVSITGTNGPVEPGNTLDVTADVSNSGTDQDTQTVTLDINNSVGQVDSTSVTLSGGGSTTQTLSWAVPSGQAEQDYTATVASADDTASQTVTVGSAAFTTSMFQNPIQQYSAAVYGGADGDSPFALPEVVTGSSASAEGTPTFRANQSGFAAAEYDGSNDGHNGLTADLPTGGVQVSFAALVYVDSVNTGRVFAYGDGGNGSTALLAVRSGQTVEATVLGSSFSFARGGTYQTGQWITIGASFDTDTATAYLNGSSVASDGGSNYNLTNQDAGIGYTGANQSFYFDGYIAEVVVSLAAEPDQTFTDYHNDRI